MKTWSIDRVFAVSVLLLAISLGLSSSSGCGRAGGVVGETEEYSYEDVQAQIRAEEAAAEAERAAEQAGVR